MLVPGFLWTSSHVPFSFAGFVLQPFNVRNPWVQVQAESHLPSGELSIPGGWPWGLQLQTDGWTYELIKWIHEWMVWVMVDKWTDDWINGKMND
jgi:hypothetical protein